MGLASRGWRNSQNSSAVFVFDLKVVTKLLLIRIYCTVLIENSFGFKVDHLLAIVVVVGVSVFG